MTCIDTAFDWLIGNLGTVNILLEFNRCYALSTNRSILFIFQYPKFDEILEKLRLQKRGTGKFLLIYLFID